MIGVGILAVTAAAGGRGSEGLVLLGVFVAAGTRIVPSAARLINAFAAVRFARAPLDTCSV